ncbi:MAG: hypothetical protein ABIM59_03480, partial [candidate division WOR-3 bacterium]
MRKVVGLLFILLVSETLFTPSIWMAVRAQQEENSEANRMRKLEELVKRAVYEGWSDEDLKNKLAADNDLSELYNSSAARIFRLIDGTVRVIVKSHNKSTCYKILKKVEGDEPHYNIYSAPWGPKDNDIVYAMKYNETHGRFFKEYRLSSRALSRGGEEWVFVGTVSHPPPEYDPNVWRYEPSEAEVWAIKGLVEEGEAKSYEGNPEYKLEKDGRGMKFRQVNYFNVYRIVTKVLYHHYKWVGNPIREFVRNGGMDSTDYWLFDKFGEASGELSPSSYVSMPTCLKITTGSTGYGAWRQSFNYDGSQYPRLEFRYRLGGRGVVTIKAPGGEAWVIPLGASYEWAEFSRDVSDILVSAGGYEISFVAQRDSELYVDDVSLRTGGGGEWVYLGDVEEPPAEIPEDEDYKPFHKVVWEYVGTFSESDVSSYSTSEYVIMFDHVDTITYYVDLYILYGKEKAKVYNVYYRRAKEGTYYYWMEPTGRVVKEAHDYVANQIACVTEGELNDFIRPNCLVEKEAGEYVLETYTFSEDEAKDYRGKEGYVILNASAIPWELSFEIPVILGDTRIEGLGILGENHTLVLSINNSYRPLQNYLVRMLDTTPKKGYLSPTPYIPPELANWTVEPKQNPVSVDIPVGNHRLNVGFQPYLCGRTGGKEVFHVTDPESIYGADGKKWDPVLLVILEVQLLNPEGRVVARYLVPYAFESGAWLYQNIYNKLPDWAKEVWNGVKEYLPEVLTLVAIYYLLP